MYLVVEPRRDRALHARVERGRVERVRRGAAVWPGRAPGTRSGPPRVVYVRDGFVLVRGLDTGAALALVGPAHLTALEALAGAEFRTRGEAVTDATVVRLDGPAVLRGLGRTTHTLPRLLDALHRAAEEGADWSARAGGPDAAARLTHVLADFGARLADDEGWLPACVTHRLLAELAGLHRSTVTTLLNDWIYDGSLGQRGRRLRVDPPGRPG